ncbi:hypothetical protein LTR93_012303 [Exophiala xenobiotica]|nr:hypothetical protein LTR93_012303 [Exophiala xenobiotica]
MEANTDEDLAKWEYTFTNSSVVKMHDHRPSSAKSSSGCSSLLHSLDSTLTSDEVSRYYETPLSSVCGEEFIDAAILTGATGLDLNDAVEVVDLTNVDKKFPRKFSAAKASTSDPASPGGPGGSMTTRATPDQRVMGVQDNDQSAICEEVSKGCSSVTDERLDHECPPAVDSDDDQYEVETLLGKRRRGRGVQYLVKWRGYPNRANSWSKTKDINADLVIAFEADLGRA